MNRIYAALLLMMGMAVLGAENPGAPAEDPQMIELPEPASWHQLSDNVPGVIVTNRTDEPISFRWYEAPTTSAEKLTGYFSTTLWKGYSRPKYTDTTTGTKQQLTAIQTLRNHEFGFVAWPKARTSGYRRQLLFSHNPENLKEQLETSVVAARPDIAVLDRNNELLGDPSLVPPSIILDKASEDETTKNPLAKIIELKKEPVPARPPGTLRFQNRSNRTVYYGWYLSRWSTMRKAYLDPSLVPGSTIQSLKAGERLDMTFPGQSVGYNQQLELLFSFDESLLRGETSNMVQIKHDRKHQLPKGILSRTIRELKPFEVTWEIFEGHGTPVLISGGRTINLINTTNEPIYGAIYYVGFANKVSKFGPSQLVTKIEPQLAAQFHFPENRWLNERRLYLATEEHKELLSKQELTPSDLKLLCEKSFRGSNITNWYLDGTFSILTDVTKEPPCMFKVESPGGGMLGHAVTSKLDVREPNFNEQNELERRLGAKEEFKPYSGLIDAAKNDWRPLITDPAGLVLEIDYLEARKETIRTAINSFLNDEQYRLHEGDPVPRIALVFTGGGYRAMIETIGFMRGAEEIGIFDAAAFMTGLSGSTWAINPLVASGLTPKAFSDAQRNKVNLSRLELYSELARKTDVSYFERRFIENRFGQYHGITGFYGHALANSLLRGFEIDGKGTHNITLTDLRQQLLPTKYPLPVSVAIDRGSGTRDRAWYEFSPFYIGTRKTPIAGAISFLDTRFFGSSYKNGLIKHYVPEYPLAHFMGIWGSAFAVTTDDVAKENSALGAFVKVLDAGIRGASYLYNAALFRSPSKNVPVCPQVTTAGIIPNPTYKSELAIERLRQEPVLCLIDGGNPLKEDEFRHNFATIPALTRKADLLIMCDSPENPDQDVKSVHLVAASDEANTLGYPFPNLFADSQHETKLKDVPKNESTLFEQKNAPPVVYMKGQTQKGYKELNYSDADVLGWTHATNFEYTPEQYTKLSGLAEYIMTHEQTKNNIKEALKIAIRRMRQSPPSR